LKNGFIESKSFATSSYVSYAFNFLDQFLVSIFLSAEILGSFTVAKNILSIARTFVENFFDPMIQSLVSLKDSIKNFKIKLNKIFKIRNVLLVVSVIFIPFLLFFLDKALVLLRIDHYPYLNNYIILIYLSIIALIASKVKYTYISLFFPQESYLKIKVINALSALVFFIIVASISPKLLFLNTLLTNIVMFIYSEKYFNNKKNPFYNEVCNKR
jgi:O-antigen/teichoic acid export membrane protein